VSGSLGYDPVAVERLRHETTRAVEALGGLRCGDVAAERADDAVVALRRVLEAHWLATIRTIQHLDPLSGGSSAGRALAVGRAWQRQSAGRTGRFRRWSDARLFEELVRLQHLLPIDDEFRPDVGDPFWTDFAALAHELADRAATRPEVAEQILAGVVDNPLLALAVGFAPFPPSLVASMTIEVLQRTSHIDDVDSRYDAHAAEVLLANLLSHPALVLDVIIDLPALRELIHWPLISNDLVAEFVQTGLLHPHDDPARTDDGLLALEHFVELANQGLFETGFEPPVSSVIASGLASYLPTFVDSLEPGDDVVIRPPHRVTSEEFVDLLGALLHDPAASDVLVAAVRSMAILSQVPGSPFDLSDVGDLGLALTFAAENERLEADLRAAASRAMVHDIALVVGLAAGAIASTRGLGTTVRSMISQLVNRGGDAAASTIGAAETGIEDPAAAVEAVIELTVCETFLADPDRYRDPAVPIDRGMLDDARSIVREIGELVQSGASPAQIDDRLRELQRTIKALGGQGFLEVLDTGSIRDLDRRTSLPDI
jgi:hypothetical protein